MNVKNLIGLESQEKFSKLSRMFLICQKSWNFLFRMISGCFGSSILEKLGKLRTNFHPFQATPGYRPFIIHTLTYMTIIFIVK